MQKNTQHTGESPLSETVSTAQRFTRRIGSTTYRVAVHFNQTSKETLNDKITRMIKNETAV